MLKVLLAQLKQYTKDALLTPLFSALEVVMEVLMPLIIAKIIDDGINAGNITNVYLYGTIMLGMACLSLLFGYLAGKYAASSSTGFAANVRMTLYEKIQTFAFSNIDRFSTAGLVTRMTTDVTNIQNAFQMSTRIAVRAPLTLIFSLMMCFIIDVRLSLIFLVAILILGCALGFIVTRTMKLFDAAFTRYDELNASVQENVSAIRVVKAYVREKYENEKFTEAAGNLYHMFVKAEKLISLNAPIMNFVVYFCILAISWFGARFVVSETLTTGELTSMFSYVMSVLSSLMMLSMIFVMLTMSLASGKRIVKVLEEVPDLANPENPVMDVKDGSIVFDHVDFTYHKTSSDNALNDINLQIQSGETIGIIGGTGCGKSSLVALISRLYDVTAGSVKVGGVDVREYDMEVLRKQVSVVLQKNVLFSGTILENLRWGNENASEEECIAACKLACADEFVEQFPDKYNTYIEQGGTNVSGGQKQRLCIARALLKNPKILILDDSTSAVDTATDARIRAAFAKTIPGTTKIIISQRVSSVMDADRILVLDDGRVNGFDTHENLLENNAIYREIYDTQTRNADFDEADAAGKEV